MAGVTASAEHLGRGIYQGIRAGPGSSIPNTRAIRIDVVAALKELKLPAKSVVVLALKRAEGGRTT